MEAQVHFALEDEGHIALEAPVAVWPTVKGLSETRSPVYLLQGICEID